MNDVLAAVRERIDPDADERERMESVASELVARAGAAAEDLPVEADVVRVGSTARNTWLSGDRDVDVFVRFPPDLPREDLEDYGLRVGNEVLPDGHEEFAEHPYVTGSLEGFDVDVVPCYDVASASDIKSAVDRTPFHTEYVRAHLTDDRAADVRLLKAFAKGVGVYGSDLRTRGLSGFLTELLVLEYGGFVETLEAAADWHPPVRLDPEGHGTETYDDPLVVVDPTDPERNVAAVCSAANVARLQHHARAFLADPTEDRFEPLEPDPLAAEDVVEHVERRGTTPLAVRFDAPDLVDDQLYPQLRKSLAGVTDELDRRGFDVFRAATWAESGGATSTGGGTRTAGTTGDAVLFVELAVAERPAVECHEGPPVHVRDHATGFYDKYADDESYGPFVDDDRYVVERAREFEAAAAFLESDALFDVALGTHVESALRDDYEVLDGDDVAHLAEAFGVELASYFDPAP